MPDINILHASAQEMEAIQDLWSEYWESLELPADFQNFTEERSSLPGIYAPPKGRLLLALFEGKPAGTAALRPLKELSCEAKRLYVPPPLSRSRDRQGTSIWPDRGSTSRGVRGYVR